MAGSKRLLRGTTSRGTWECRVYVQCNPRTGRPGQLSRVFEGGARAADRFMSSLQEEHSKPKPSSKGRTVAQLLSEWLEHIERQGRSPLTLREYRRLVEKTIDPALGAVKLDELSGHALDSLYGELAKKRGLSSGSIRQVHSILRAALKQAVRWSWLASNPADAATPPRPSHESPEAPTTEDVLALIRAAEEEDLQLAAFIALAAVTGARRGELLGLRWGDVDFAAETLLIERSVAVLERGETLYKPTKTHQSRRIAIDGFAVEALLQHRAEMEAFAADAEVELEDSTPLFTYDLERPLSPDTVTHYVRNLSRRLGIPTHLHALRHYAATQLVAGGHDVRTVAGRLGHSDATTTLRTYAHVLPQKDREAAKALGAGLAGRGTRAK